MTLVQKILGVIVAIVGIVVGVLFLVYHKALLHQVMEPVAVKLRYDLSPPELDWVVMEEEEEGQLFLI